MPRCHLLVFSLLSFLIGASSVARAAECRDLRIVFRPDCFRADLAAPCNPRKNGSQLDLGPQIAVWLEQEGRLVATLMVTNLTARRGLGNRPGRWDHGSAPKFPYGRRTNVLPIWAHARGRLFPRVVMQNGEEDWLGFHELISSVDPYYCRPMALAEIDVDAVTCPTATFNSAKGKFDETAQEYYPPRSDLVNFTSRDCDVPGAIDNPMNPCARSAERFAMMNDLDLVATATPPYQRDHLLRYRMPSGLAAGRYTVRLEINKEFDQNASHAYMAFTDRRLPESGVKTNIGQPSVLYEVPFVLSETPDYAATQDYAGYGAWDGSSGNVFPPDATISRSPGSGAGRLVSIPSPWHPASEGRVGRVHVSTSGCDPCNPPPPAPSVPAGLAVSEISATGATVSFLHAAQDGGPVEGYEIRYRQGRTMSEAEFSSAVSVLPPMPGTPGSQVRVTLVDLKAQSDYVIAVRALGRCDTRSELVTATFQTDVMRFAQLSGCFVATAAHGSNRAPVVSQLRIFRDRVLMASVVGQGLVDLYYREGPVLADAIARAPVLRAITRDVLAPVAGLAETVTALTQATSVLQAGPARTVVQGVVRGRRAGVD